VKIAEITRGDQRMFGFDWDVSESKGQDSVFKIKSTSLGTEYEVDAETAAKFNEANSKDQSASSPLAYLMNGMVSAAFGRDVGQLSPDVFNVTIRAWEQNGDIDFLSNPKLIVANEETATIDMTTKEPYIKTTRQSGSALAGGGTSPDIITAELSAIPGKEQDENVAFFQHGITVKVTPRIEDSGDTTIKVKPVLSKKVKDVAMTSDTNYLAATIPIIFAKTVDTEFTLADGYTAVIGGLTETDKQEYVDAIPFLSRIPVIGKILFTKKSTKNVQRETIIFVTVTRADVRPMDVKAGLPQNASLVQKQMKRMVPQEQEKEAAQPPPANPKRKSWLPWRR
jgi:type II secretory pathway component GspD/PulD (secretin)